MRKKSMRKNTKVVTKTMSAIDTKLIIATLVALAASGVAFAVTSSIPQTLTFEPQGLSARYSKRYTYRSDSCVLQKAGTEKVCVVDSKYANKKNWNDECYLQKVVGLANNGNCDFIVFQPKLSSIEFNNTVTFGNTQSTVVKKKTIIDGGWGRTQKIVMAGAKNLIQTTDGSKNNLSINNVAMKEGSFARLNNTGDSMSNVMLEFNSKENNSKDILLSGRRTGANEFIGSIFSVEGGRGMSSGGGQASEGSGFVYIKYDANGWSAAVEGSGEFGLGKANASAKYEFQNGNFYASLGATEGLLGVSGGIGMRIPGSGQGSVFTATGNVGSAIGFLSDMLGDDSQSTTLADTTSDESHDQNKNDESQSGNDNKNSDGTQTSDQTASKNEDGTNNNETADSNNNDEAKNNDEECAGGCGDETGETAENKNNSSAPSGPEEQGVTQEEYFKILVMLGVLPKSDPNKVENEIGVGPMSAKERADYEKIKSTRANFGRRVVVTQINLDTLIGSIYENDKEFAVWMLKGKNVGDSRAAARTRLEIKAAFDGTIDPAPMP